jgi:Transglutaminase-like superfamily
LSLLVERRRDQAPAALGQPSRAHRAGHHHRPDHLPDPAEPGQAPSEADLAATEDAPISDVVKAQAAELGNNPAAILRWVHNNLEWVPSWGSLQGAEATVVMRRGNAADIASATVALLRGANIPARYVVGTIEVDADRLVNWIGGAESVEAAMSLMQQGGIATVGVSSAGRIVKVRMEHVWVQAYVNWAPSRGARQGSGTQHVNPVGPHNSWVDIDPSFKRYTFSTPLDIAAAVPLDVTALRNAVTAGETVNTTQGFVSGIQESAAIDQIRAYGQRVQAYLDTRPNLTVPDLVKKREIASDTAEYLSGALPNSALTAQVLTALPSSMRHAITLRLYASQADRAAGAAALNYRVTLAALNYRRLGVSYEGASAADQQVIDSAVASGATSLPAYLVNVRPVLTLDGTVVATGPTTRMASEQYWTVGFEDPAGANGGEADFSNSAGDELVFGLNANGVAADLVYKRASQTATGTAQGNLEMAALLYWLEHDLFDQMAAGETKVLAMRMPSVIQTAMPLTTRYFFGVARTASYQSVSGDARRVLSAAAGSDENARRRFALTAGLQGSSIEGSVLDQLYSRPEETSVSTTQYLAIAMRQGLKLYSITGENLNAVLPLLGTSQSVKDDIVNAVAAGMVAFVPERDITHKGYTGIGYMRSSIHLGSSYDAQSGGHPFACDCDQGEHHLALRRPPLDCAGPRSSRVRPGQRISRAG